MHHTGSKVSFWAAVSMGIGSMVGAGIFALMGDAGSIAGSAVWISFVLGGIIALLSGYSIGRLGATFPSAGGFVEYLVRGFGPGLFSGAMSVMLYLSAMVAISLVARTFGAYALVLLPKGAPSLWEPVFSALIIIGFMVLNLRGARDMAMAEVLIVVLKLAVLAVFAIAGLAFIDPARLAPATYPPAPMVFYALALTFFAYEGFRVITNAAADMPDPAKTLPRAITTSILIVMVLYVALAFAVFGNLPLAEVIKARDYALADAAKPVFGHAGFVVVALAALLATASAINASLYAVTNVTYQLAVYGQLPKRFGHSIGHSREGLVISSAIIMLLAVFLDLSQIAAIGALGTLIVHLVVHIGHLRLRKKTAAPLLMIVLAIVACFVAIAASSFYIWNKNPALILGIGALAASAFMLELALRLITHRVILPGHLHKV